MHMKTCYYCGSAVQDNAAVCPSCGTQLLTVDPANGYAQQPGAYAPQPDYNNQPGAYAPQPGYSQPGAYAPQPGYNQPGAYAPPVTRAGGPQMSFEEFKAAVGTSAIDSGFKALGIIALISAALCTVLAIFLNPVSAVDAVLNLVVGLVIIAGKKRSKGILIFMIVYFAISAVASLAMGSAPGGIVVLIVTITTLSKVKKLEQAYQNYLSTGMMPNESF